MVNEDDDGMLRGQVDRRDGAKRVDLEGLNRAIHRQAVLTVRWCLLFHRRDAVELDVENDIPVCAVDVDDRGLDEALRWLPAELITREPGRRAHRVRLADLDQYLNSQ